MRRILVVLVVAGLLLLAGAAFVVQEYDQVVITQFGKPVRRPVQSPGIHLRVPLIQKVHRFEKRFLEWDGDPNQLPTRDKRFVYTDTYARWRIADPLLFFQRLRDERGAQTRLDDILDGETRNAIASHDLVELIRSTNRVPESGDILAEDATELDSIRTGRDRIREEILRNAQGRTSDLGIEILDIQFKRINYVEEVRLKVYERMIAERMRIAERFRSEGEGEASRIGGERERELMRVQSGAYRTAQEIIGEADARAATIYARAYNRSVDSREFYAFLKTMEAYGTTFGDGSTILLSTDAEFFHLLKRSK